MTTPVITDVFEVQVNEDGRLCIDVLPDGRDSEGNITLESGHIYVFRQPGESNAGLIKIQVITATGAIPIELVQTTNGQAVTYVPSDTGSSQPVADGLVVSYYGRLTVGTMEQLTQTQYKSYLDQSGECYVRLVMPTALVPSSAKLCVSADGFGIAPNVYKAVLINPLVRVQTGDYVWMEAVVEEQSTDAITGDVSWVQIQSTQVGDLAERLICSVAIERDRSIQEDAIY